MPSLWISSPDLKNHNAPRIFKRPTCAVVVLGVFAALSVDSVFSAGSVPSNHGPCLEQVALVTQTELFRPRAIYAGFEDSSKHKNLFSYVELENFADQDLSCFQNEVDRLASQIASVLGNLEEVSGLWNDVNFPNSIMRRTTVSKISDVLWSKPWFREVFPHHLAPLGRDRLFTDMRHLMAEELVAKIEAVFKQHAATSSASPADNHEDILQSMRLRERIENALQELLSRYLGEDRRP